MSTILNIWIGNLGKYNEGELKGGWIELPVSEETLETFIREEVGCVLDSQEAHERMMAGEEVYEEFFIADYESDYFTVGEWDNVWKLNKKAEEIANLSIWEEKVLKAAVEWLGDEALEHDIDDFVFIEGIENNRDLAYYYVEETGMLHGVPDEIARFFDYEAYGEYLENCSSCSFVSDGYIECIN